MEQVGKTGKRLGLCMKKLMHEKKNSGHPSVGMNQDFLQTGPVCKRIGLL